MDLQLGNLLFTLVAQVFFPGLLVLAAIVITLRLSKKLWKKTIFKRKTIHRLVYGIWFLGLTFAVITAVMSNSPRITLEDYGKQSPNYSEKPTMQDLNPNQKSDQERLKETRSLVEETQIEGIKSQ